MSLRSVGPYMVLLGGVVIVASASIMIRFAQDLGVSSATIAAGRLGLAALVLLPLVVLWGRAEVQTLRRREWLLGVAAGVFLAIHFLSWISSLEYTSVASSAALVSTNPLWVALISLVLFHERFSPLRIAGLVLTIGGSALIGFSDSSNTAVSNALLGDALALLGAIAGSAYFLIGRVLRRTLSLLSYIWLVYTSAAVALVGVALFTGQATLPDLPGRVAVFGVPLVVLALLAGLALGPQLLGHTALNWSLRYLSATFVAIALLGEPIGSALLAFAIFGEQFVVLQLVGFVALLAGIGVAAYDERTPAARAAKLAAEGPEVAPKMQ